MATFEEIFDGILTTADELNEAKERAAHATSELGAAIVLLADTRNKNEFPLFVHVTRAYLELKTLMKGSGESG